MQFSMENRYLASTNHENDVFASKNAPEVTLCIGIVNDVVATKNFLLNFATKKVHNLVDALFSFERSRVGCK